MTLGQKICTLRSEIGLTQKELAAQLGITTGTIAEWEADETTPNLSELSRLSKALNVSSDVLLETTIEEISAPVSQPKQEPITVVAPAKKRKKTGWIIGSVAVIIALAIGVAFLFQSTPFADNASAIEKADASVVKIFCYDYEGELAATGSGFVAYDSKTIITNYHVMTSAYTCKVSTNQDISYEVSKILCYSEEQDIAILQLSEDTELVPLTLGDSNIIKKGETVVAIGSPLGIKNNVSTGVLSGRLMEDNMDVLQFTAPISNGSSGGALFDNSGNVIGITFASIVDGQNLNLAIPIELAINLYNARGTAENVSTIYIEKYPYIEYLKNNDDISPVTTIELKRNPELYDDKQILLCGVACTDGDYFFVLDKDYYNDYSSEYPPHNLRHNFDDNPYIFVIRGYECEYSPSELAIGEEVVIIGTFKYEAKGEKYVGVENGSLATLTSTENYAELRAKFVYYPSETSR